MTIALISDIHGNYTALKEVLRKIDEMNIKEIYCLGDIVGYYTEINECCEALRAYNVSPLWEIMTGIWLQKVIVPVREA